MQPMVESPRFHVEHRLDQDVLVLAVTTAALDYEDATTALREELVQAATATGARKAVIDLKRVTFIASPGIRALLGFRRSFLDRGGRLVLCSLNELIRDALSTARLIGTAGSSPPVLFETTPDQVTGILYLRGPQSA